MIFLLAIDTPEDKGKFTILYERYRYLMLKLAIDVLQDRFLAEDAVHNAFIKLAMNMDDIGEPESQQTKRYLITVVKNTAIDMYRKKNVQIKREIYMDELREEELPTAYLETDLDNEVLDILKNLPIKYRDIFLLKYSAHLENSKIARLCGIQESTVRQRIARGKLLIEDALQKLEQDGHEKFNVTDEWLYKYMPIVDEAIIRELENETDYEYQFSSKFEHRMEKLIKRAEHPWRSAFYRLSKKAAVLFVCVISSLFIITMSVQAYRVKFFETVKSIWEDYILYSYNVDQNQGIIQCNEPGYIPEGYCEADRIILEHWFSVTYANEDGKIITWDQMLVQEGEN